MEIKVKREEGNQGDVKEMPSNVTLLPQTFAAECAVVASAALAAGKRAIMVQ